MESNTSTTTTTNEIQMAQQITDTFGMTPEQEEEIKLRSKYPNPQKPGGSTFIQKMLYKGNKKYFDSGDYNMAKSRKASSLNNNNNNTNTNNADPNNSGRLIPQQKILEESIGNKTMSPTTPNIAIQQTSPNSQSSNSSGSNNASSIIQLSNQNASTPTISHNNHHNHHHNLHHHLHTPQIKSNNNSPASADSTKNSPLSMSSSDTSPSNTSNSQQNHSALIAKSNQLSGSTSSSSINMLISSSFSSDRLSNMQSDSFLDSEEIGHGIPRPECLPQSRKHSIAQSKLAAPRLSTSSS